MPDLTPTPSDRREKNDEILLMFANDWRRHLMGRLVDLVYLEGLQATNPKYVERQQAGPGMIREVGIDEMVESQKLSVKTAKQKLVAVEELLSDKKVLEEVMSEDNLKPKEKHIVTPK